MPTLTANDLTQFSTGTGNWYRHSLNRDFLYTDGVKYVAETGGAYWLIDEIAIANMYNKNLQKEEFQTWTLKRLEDSSATLRCHDGNELTLLRKRIPFTDFPLEEITFFYENNVLCLPCER